MIANHQFADLPYSWQAHKFRVLWHQTLGSILRYPQLPRKCLNFDGHPITKVKSNRQTTLSSTVTTLHQRYIEDAKVTEIWLADDLSMLVGFFYELLNFYNTQLDAGDYLIWFPKDRTETAFAIQPLDLIVGSSEDMSVNPQSSFTGKDLRYLRDEVRFEFQILRPFDLPDAIALLEGN
jgi:hypothetical protein